MEERTLSNSNMSEAHANVSDIKVVGNAGNWVTVYKASSEKQGFMKSTKALSLEGCNTLVQTETMQRNPDGSFSLSQALVYIPLLASSIFGSDWPQIEKAE